MTSLLADLEVTTLPLSEVLRENDKLRIDPEYFSKAAIEAERVVSRVDNRQLGQITSVFRKGIFDIKADTYVEAGEGVPFVRIGDLKGGLIRKTSTAWISAEAHVAEAKTALGYGDLVLSKTAYPAAAMVTLDACNVSQDTVAVRLNAEGKKHFFPGYISVFLNSRLGYALMDRRFQGNVQQHLSLDDGKAVRIPIISARVQEQVHELVVRADRSQDEIIERQKQAEEALLRAIGLQGWSPSEPLTYSVSSNQMATSGRMDAGYFAPRIQELLKILGKNGRKVADVAEARRLKFRPDACTTFHYIEIGDLDGAGATGSSQLACSDAPDRATWHVKSGDVITSTVRPIRRLSAQIAPEQDGHVCSSGFVVLCPKDIRSELLLTYLRLPAICELLDLYASASMYPAITEADILGLPIPRIEDNTAADVVANAVSARAARALSVRLIETAKRAVEVALEEGGDAADAFLKSVGGAL